MKTRKIINACAAWVALVLIALLLSSPTAPPAVARNSTFTADGVGPLAWSTYEHQYSNNTPMPEDRWKNNIDWLATNFKPYGFDLAMTDGWIEGATRLNPNGYILSHNDSWTHDWKYWGDYLAAKGMKLGVYYNPLWISPTVIGHPEYKIAGTNIPVESLTNADDRFNGGQPTSLYWIDVSRPGAEQYVKGYVNYFKQAGAKMLRVDFLSWYEDGIDKGRTVGQAHGRQNYETVLRWMAEACGDDMELSLVMPHLYNNGELEFKYGDWIRVNEDAAFGDWGRFSDFDRGTKFPWWSQYHNAFDGLIYWSQFSGKGKMILDADFLRIHNMFADQEKRSAVSLVMISGAPLIMADQYDTIGQAAWVYQNSELLDLRRQGLVAKPFSFDPKNADSMRWKGQLPDGSWVVGLFNRDDGNVTRSIDFAADLGISGNATIHDLWTHQDIGAGTSYSASIGKHDVKLLRIIPGGPTATPAPRTPTTTATPGTPTVTPPPGNADIVRTEKVLAGISADKSRYAPGSSVTFTVNVLNSTGSAINGGAVTLYFRSRETSLASPISQPLSVGNGSSATLTFRWTAPQLDFTGYLVSAVATDSAGNPLDLINTAVDVSSSWVKFPRYGYMTNNTFGIQNLSAAQAQSIMNTMTKYHIDGLQFYDWMYNHHQPLCGTVSNPCSSWISDGNQRTVYASSLKNLINAAHANNIMAMPYNAIFSADNGTCCGAPNYRTDGSGVDPAWGIYQDANHQKPLAFFQWDYMDPSNPNWQRHLMDQTLMANQAFGFDGFHGDTFGDPNVVAYKYDGTPAGVATNPCTTDTTNADSGIPVNNVAGSPTWINGTFPPFLNYAKQRLGNAYLMFNPVSYAHAHCEANSSPSDILYTELWPNEQDHYWDYNTIKDAIDIAFAESKPHSADGQGKSMIVAAYSNFREGGGGSHNTPSVLLLNATMFASGGGHIELGDTGLMLNYQEYRAGATPMSSELTQAMVNYYDFMTGYQNLLRNGQENTSRTVTVQGQTTSSKAAPNSVWAFTKADSKYEILHLINLVGESSIYWQTGNCDRCTHLAPLHPAPTTLTNVTVKYYNAKPVNGVLFASPDYNGGMTYSVPFTKGSDSGGEFVSFTLPSLQYWDMVYMSQTGPGDAPQLPGTPRTPTPTVTATPVTPTPVTPTPVTPTPVTPTATPNNQNLVTNGGFETGTIQGWTEWHPGGQSAKYGVDGNDVHSGAKKLWFWNASGYQQSVHQVKTGLPNGSYTVRAWVKQNTGTPNIARMEVASYGGSTVYVNVPKGNSYNLYSATVNVTNGQIDIGFYIYATGGDANLQIDDVELVKN